MIASAPLLTVRGVAVDLGSIRALDGFDLEVCVGERVGLVGPNGAGKSTLLDVLIGRTSPDAGAILFDGRDISGLVSRERVRLGIGIVLQGGRVLEHLTVGEHLALAQDAARRRPGRSGRGLPTSASVREVLALSDLEPGAIAAELSHAQRQWLGLMTALMTGPRLLLLDEPTSGMGHARRARTVSLLQRIHAAVPYVSMLIVEHDRGVIDAVTDRVVEMRDGRQVAGRPVAPGSLEVPDEA